VPPPVSPRDPWRSAPVGELGEQLLPRWFVILAVVMVPVAIGAVIAAFVVFRPADVPLAERRPPPADDLTSAVGEYVVGEAEPEPYDDACPTLQGVQIAGTDTDQQALRLGLAGLCNVSLPSEVSDRLARFAQARGVVRFSAFEQTGVDSTAQLDADPPRILVNARLQLTDPLWIAPAVAHDVTFLDADPGTAAGALEARRVEALVCDRLLGGRRASRGCDDARQLLELPDPTGALQAAGFR
jgi:hypothetical protein